MKEQFKSQYQPSPEEVKKAEDVMSSEEEKMSKEREITYGAGYQVAERIYYPEKKITDFIKKIEKEYGHQDVEIDIGGDLCIGTLGSIYEGADYLEFYEKGNFKDMWDKPVDERKIKILLKDIKGISIAGNRFKIIKNKK